MRQGNPAWAGYPNDHDGFETMRASQMFMDEGSGQFWNDLGDGALNDVPQADIQLRLFSNAVVLSNAAKRPLPRLWYFPDRERSLLLLTGDQHGDSSTNSVNEIDTIESYGGKFTEFLWYPFGSISSSLVSSWTAAGHSMHVHFDDIGEEDSTGTGGSAASWSGMESVLDTALASFASRYPSAPFPSTTRTHYLVWVSRDAAGAPDQTAQAKLYENAGIEMDFSYTAFPNRWGYMTGSGLPMKFLDTTTGDVIPVYEQATQYEDDVQLSSYAYSTDWSYSTATNHYLRTLSDSLTKYNTVVAMLFHPDTWNAYSEYVEAVLGYAQTNSIPISSSAAWLQFWKGRAATTVSNPSYASNTLDFTASGSPAGLTLLVPYASGTRLVSAFTVDGAAKSYTVESYQGVMYASVVLPAGSHAISVAYASGGRIVGQISPIAAATGATVVVQGGTTTQSVSVAADGTYAVGPLPAGTYSVTPSSTDYTFSPTSRSVTLGSDDVIGVDFAATAVPTFSISGTLAPAAGGAGATVTISGAADRTITADAAGGYAVTGLTEGTYTVTPSKLGYSFSPASASITVDGASVSGVDFTATANGGGQTLFTTQTPALTNETDGPGDDYELGMALRSAVPGQITAVRFWKASNESGTHTGRIWSSTGTLLASVIFTGETASGWQQQALPIPVTIAADTTYVVSVNTGNTYYVATNDGLASEISQRRPALGGGQQRGVRRSRPVPQQHLPGIQLLPGRGLLAGDHLQHLRDHIPGHRWRGGHGHPLRGGRSDGDGRRFGHLCLHRPCQR